MKKTFFILWLCFGLLVPGAAGAETVTVATGEWPPWAGKDLPGQGFVLQVVREAFAEAGLKVRYEFVPWARALTMTAEGKVDASAYWYKSPNVEKDCYYSDVLTHEKIVFFHRKSTQLLPWNTLEDLAGYRIGASLGVTYTEEIVRLGKEGVLTVDIGKDNLMNFNKLVNDRIDLLPSPLAFGLKTLRDNFPLDARERITFDPRPLTERTGHLIFPRRLKRSDKLLKAFNRGLRRLIKSGRFGELQQDLAAGKYD